ncbi:hypothetical protein DSL72_006710 [Monilinia vaccinii-corymbosi]|uniref:Pentacotripeptide-repeat region of PRORP domain-containing protein n=1 Tax=Monilinia vaccinii-corymbosi TaxID=61207 RepID=A0A8A3PMY0_9HELO|nr:hypothetical protein DSL72_006710 [Monilinia vaccinii-corymbosi]
MRSQLTRRVFRGLLSNEGLVLPCPNRAPAVSTHRRRRIVIPTLSYTSRRSLFGFSRNPPRQPRQAELEPGIKKMAEFSLMTTIHARTANRDDMLKAFNEFFKYKTDMARAVNNTEAGHALRTLNYLVRCGLEQAQVKDLKTALKALTTIPKDDTNDFLGLARALFLEIKNLSGSNEDRPSYDYFIRILCGVRQSLEARDLCEDVTAQFQDEKSTSSRPERLISRQRKALKVNWYAVLSGFAQEGNEAELLKTYERMEELRLGRGATSQEIIVKFYTSQDRVLEAKLWFEKAGFVPTNLTPSILQNMLKFCLRHEELLDWCKGFFRKILEADQMQKETWDVVFQWAASAMDKGVEDVERMMRVMEKRYPENPSMRPDIDTINGLVEYAISKNDPYLAERYIALGQKFQIRPNARTFILQMDYRVGAGDLSGAQVAYNLLQSEEISEDEDLPVINKFVRALCASENLPYNEISSIISDLDERNVRFEADTVSSLSMMYISRNQLDDVVDLLRVNTYHYTLAERARIRDALLAFCFDKNNDDYPVWDTYRVIVQIFDETDIPMRTRLMNEFFDRKRSDMACHVFGHMRQHINPSRRPVLDTYIDCFVGIASCADGESLDIVHNMLKMDSTIDPNTRLYNSLMLAYTACDDASRSLHFWDDITNSREGPSYRSLEIVFQACQRKPFGDQPAREIWAKMKRMEIEITREVHAAYAGALAGQGKLDEVKVLVEGMEDDVGFGPDVLTIGTIYNAIQGSNRKDLVAEWTKELYPEVWKEVEKLGFTEHEEGHMVLNMPEKKLKA